jgi:hypothetical protein
VRQPGLQFGSFLKIPSQDSRRPVTKGRKGSPDDRNLYTLFFLLWSLEYLVIFSCLGPDERGGEEGGRAALFEQRFDATL